MVTNEKHEPVLLEAAIAALNLKPDGIYVDCTFGYGGHTKAILKQLTTGKLIALDEDRTGLIAKQALMLQYPQLTLVADNFSHLATILALLGIFAVDGILYDLGLNSAQFADQDRGFSYHLSGPLDMRLDQTQPTTAAMLLATTDEATLKFWLQHYGGEYQYAGLLAKAILQAQHQTPITTTDQLVSIVKRALPAKALRKAQHPARKVFQALRIAVNQELTVLQQSLLQASTLLKPGGRLAVISFHSGEDKIVKTMFKALVNNGANNLASSLPTLKQVESEYKLITSRPIVPTADEIARNRRARSAHLRILARRLPSALKERL